MKLCPCYHLNSKIPIRKFYCAARDRSLLCFLPKTAGTCLDRPFDSSDLLELVEPTVIRLIFYCTGEYRKLLIVYVRSVDAGANAGSVITASILHY